VVLKDIFLGLQTEMVSKLRTSRSTVPHPTAKGNVTESSWRSLLEKYLPERYAVESAFVIDSQGNMSDQIDLVIFDRHFSPFLFHDEGAKYIPAESVYAVFEIRQEASTPNVVYAARKAESVRMLKRTSVAIRHAGGKHAPVIPKEIIAGLLALTTPGKGCSLPVAFADRLKALPRSQRLDLVCVLERGSVEMSFTKSKRGKIEVFPADTALITFFLSLITKLQCLGSVPAMDIKAYGASLSVPSSSSINGLITDPSRDR